MVRFDLKTFVIFLLTLVKKYFIILKIYDWLKFFNRWKRIKYFRRIKYFFLIWQIRINYFFLGHKKWQMVWVEKIWFVNFFKNYSDLSKILTNHMISSIEVLTWLVSKILSNFFAIEKFVLHFRICSCTKVSMNCLKTVCLINIRSQIFSSFF